MAEFKNLCVGTCVKMKKGYGKISEVLNNDKDTFMLVNEKWYKPSELEVIEGIDMLPNDYFDKITELEDRMVLNIHNLVWKYGNKKTSEKGEIHYHLAVNIIIRLSNGLIKHIWNITISNPEKCQVMGHLWLTGDNGDIYDFTQLQHQEFNVYSGVMFELFGK